MTDTSEAPTAELPALTEEEIARARLQRRTLTSMVVMDPAYIAYLEAQVRDAHEQVARARNEADNARAVALAAGAHNAGLTEEVHRLRDQVASLDRIVRDLAAQLGRR